MSLPGDNANTILLLVMLERVQPDNIEIEIDIVLFAEEACGILVDIMNTCIVELRTITQLGSCALWAQLEVVD